jgi:hypothetical protein
LQPYTEELIKAIYTVSSPLNIPAFMIRVKESKSVLREKKRINSKRSITVAIPPPERLHQTNIYIRKELSLLFRGEYSPREYSTI